jgi:ATP-binding cassette subfamily F protein uup
MRKQPKARTTKSKSRQDNFYEVEARAKQRVEERRMELQLKMSRLGGKVTELKKVYKRFGDRVILQGFDYTFKKGERVGVIGKNGAGKSTFINIILGLEAVDSGKVNIGDTVIFGHYAQQGLQLKSDMRVIEYVKNIAESFPLANGGSLSAAQFLERFLFPPDQQYTYISRLSGGEKRRLHLLSILFRNPNFLVLDEPTNDLDLPTLGVLEEFLADFPGCLLIVSHDRYFMDRLVDHLLVFEGDGVIRDFPGNYADYRLSEEEKPKESSKPIGAVVEMEALEKPAVIAPPKRKMGFKERREFESLEKEIGALEAEKASLTQSLSDPGLPFADMQSRAERIAVITNLLDEKELRWLELSELEA